MALPQGPSRRRCPAANWDGWEASGIAGPGRIAAVAAWLCRRTLCWCAHGVACVSSHLASGTHRQNSSQIRNGAPPGRYGHEWKRSRCWHPQHCESAEIPHEVLVGRHWGQRRPGELDTPRRCVSTQGVGSWGRGVGSELQKHARPPPGAGTQAREEGPNGCVDAARGTSVKSPGSMLTLQVRDTIRLVWASRTIGTPTSAWHTCAKDGAAF